MTRTSRWTHDTDVVFFAIKDNKIEYVSTDLEWMADRARECGAVVVEAPIIADYRLPDGTPTQ